ncbi:hypothetical protein EIP91_010874 [Steccherinum ochraceum]|uniref:F-box domain-containing protein n=1 Tax=Steccherinum ochraceum TaxID=92696 RepID=A0A4R0RQ99_9APHY|nr:hypothetical protein EIP91_010874 [Steccherinum ochraceum]
MANTNFRPVVDFPSELIFNIVDFLQDRATLRAASLVNNHWHYAVRPHLYQIIRLRPYTLARFAQLLRDLPTVVYWIRYIEVFEFRPWEGGDPNSESLLRKWEEFGRIVLSGQLKKVHKMVFCDCMFPNADVESVQRSGIIKGTFGQFRNMDALSILTFEEVEIHVECFRTVYNAIPNLKKLDFVRSFTEGDLDDSDSDSSDDESTLVGSGDGFNRHGKDDVSSCTLIQLSLSSVLYIDLLPASHIASLRFIDIDKISLLPWSSPSSSYSSMIFMRNLGPQLHTLKLNLLPAAEDEYYTWNLSHCPNLRVLELRPLTHDCLSGLLDAVNSHQYLHTLQFPLPFDLTLHTLPPLPPLPPSPPDLYDFTPVETSILDFDPHVLHNVVFTYMPTPETASTEVVKQRIVETFFPELAVMIPEKLVVKAVPKPEPFVTSYTTVRKKARGWTKFERMREREGLADRSVDKHRSVDKPRSMA